MMIASLPMYDLPELRTATDAWWSGMAAALRRAGIDAVPDQLTRVYNVATVWRGPNLLLSQTCGYPLVRDMAGILQPVATPIYNAPGCDGPNYSSAIVASAEQSADDISALRGGVCAVNGRDSQSGYNCLRAVLSPLAEGKPFFARVIETGSHARSLEMISRGEADVCAIDCVTHTLLSRHRPQALANTRILGYTSHAPGLPYVTQASANLDLVYRLRDGVMAAFADPAMAGVRETLLLVGAEVLDVESYEGILAMEAAAQAQGYNELC
jgi:ABC-type phosphate/phosphonate transport system substrate-binding protein